SLTIGAEDIHLGIKGAKGDCPVAGINGDAPLAAAEQGTTAVQAVPGGAAASGLALVAGERLAAATVGAAGALEKVAAEARQAAKLWRGRRPQRFRKRRIVGPQ